MSWAKLPLQAPIHSELNSSPLMGAFLGGNWQAEVFPTRIIEAV